MDENFDSTAYQTELKKQVEKRLEDIDAPYVLYYFRAIKDGKKKIFDLHPYDEGYTIGEICLPGAPPVAEKEIACPPTNAGAYTHYQYGYAEAKTPEEAIQGFSDFYSLGLENITAGKPTHSVRAMIEQVSKLVFILFAETLK